MNVKELDPPISELPAHQIWHRVQRKTARNDSVRVNGFLLAPTGGMAGRFDLPDEPIAYLGACRTWESSAENRPQRSIFHRLFSCDIT